MTEEEKKAAMKYGAIMELNSMLYWIRDTKARRDEIIFELGVRIGNYTNCYGGYTATPKQPKRKD